MKGPFCLCANLKDYAAGNEHLVLSNSCVFESCAFTAVNNAYNKGNTNHRSEMVVI